jgi:hypothetical protein
MHVVKKLRSFWRWLMYRDASSYLRYKRTMQGCERAGEREERWYGNPFGER